MDESLNDIPGNKIEMAESNAEANAEAPAEAPAEAEPLKDTSPIVEMAGEVDSPSASAPTGKETSPAKRSWIYRFFNFLLGADSRLGRVMRTILRWAAAVVGLFALGLLAGFLLLYQPAQKGLDSANQQIGLVNDENSQLHSQVNGLQNTLTTANKAVQGAQEELKKAQARNSLLVVIYDIADARTYLAQKDGAKLINILDKTSTDLDAVQPYLLTAHKDLADELKSRLETVRSVVIRDAQLAQSDLDNLYSALIAANDLVFGSKP